MNTKINKSDDIFSQAGCAISGSKLQYHGTNTKGSVRLLIDGERMMGIGVLSELTSMEGREPKSICVHVVPGSDELQSGSHNICFYCQRTGKKYRFIGEIRPTVKKNEPPVDLPTVRIEPKLELTNIASPALHEEPAINANLLTKEPCESIGIESTPVGAVCASASKHASTSKHDAKAKTVSRSREKLMETLAEELAAIGAARKQGLDPQLKMRHIAVLTAESDKTLYRKIANKQFPKPIHRGRSSFWNLSEVEPYMAGTWAAQDDD